MDREDKKYIESGELGCSLENESLKEETKEIITIDDSNLNDYIQEYIYPMSLDEILGYLDVEYTTEVERGPSFILPNGKILSVGRNYKDWDPDEWLIHDYVLLDICDKVFEDKIGYDNLDKDYSYSDELVNVFTDNYGVIRINTGEFESENRFYCVLPDRALNKPTLNQYETLTKFFDYGLEHGQKEVLVFLGVQSAKEHTYSLIDNTSDEIIKKIMRFYGTGTLVEKEYAQPSKLYNIDKETAYWPEDAEDWLYWSSESDKWAEDYAKSYKVKMSPKDFLDLTTEKGADSLKKGYNLGFGELKDLDIDEFNRERYQPIFLQAAFRDENQPNTAQVTGHEGRHRMFALMNSGVTSVDVELRCDVYDTNYNKYKPFKLDYIDLIGQFNNSVRVRVNNPIPMSWKQHKAIRPNLKDEELNEYLDEIETSYDCPIFVTDEVYRIKAMLQRADTPYRIYNLEETYYMQDATGNKTHGDMLQYAKEQGYIAGNTRISSEDSDWVYPEDSDEGYIVFIPKDFSGHLRWHTRLGDDDYFSCKVYPFGNLYVRDSEEYNDGLFKALGEAERTLWYDDLEGTVDIVDKNGDTRKFDVLDDLDDDPENASSVDLSSKEVIQEDYKGKNTLDALDDMFGQDQVYMWSTYILPNGHFLNPDKARDYWDEIDEEPGYEHYDFEDWAFDNGYDTQDIYNNCVKMNVTFPYLSMPDRARPTQAQLNSIRKILENSDELEDNIGISDLRDIFGDDYKAKQVFNNAVGKLLQVITVFGDKVYDLGVSNADDIIKDINRVYVRGRFDESLKESIKGDTFTFKGKKAWSGAVNTLDGTIEEVHSYRQAQQVGFHHSFYFSDSQLDKMDEGDSCFFCVFADHTIMINATNRFNSKGDDIELREDYLKDRIKEQIKFIDNVNESLSRDEIEDRVANELGTSKEPIEGSSYILEDGSFLKIWNSNKDIKGMSGSKSVSGKTMHLDVDGFINKYIDSDSYSYYYLNVDCIRVNTGFEEYIVLPKYRPNNAQFDSLEKWLNYYFFDLKHDKLKVMDWYGSYLNTKEYYLDTTMPEEIIKKIKSYYNTGELRESKGRFRVEWTTPEDSFEKSFSTYQKALDYYTDIRDGDVFWSTIEMYDTSKTPAELLAIDYKSNADIDKYLNNENLQEKIVKKGNKWQVQSEKGKNLGTYDTKEEAEKRLKQIEYFKHVKEAYFPVKNKRDDKNGYHILNDRGEIVKTFNTSSERSNYWYNLSTDEVCNLLWNTKGTPVVIKHRESPTYLYRGISDRSFSKNFDAVAGLFFGVDRNKVKGWGDVKKYLLSKDAKIYKDESSDEFCSSLYNKEYPELKKYFGMYFGDVDINRLNDFTRLTKEQQDTIENNVEKLAGEQFCWYDVWTWCLQLVAKLELEKQGYDGANWSMEDAGNHNQYQIWNLDVLKSYEGEVESFKHMNEEVDKYYRLELEDCWRNRLGLFTGAFEAIPSKETIENYPEDFEELTQEERERYYRFDELLNELSKIKSPGVDVKLQNFKEDDIFAFTSSKYNEILPIIKEMRQLLKEMGFKLIVKELDIDDVNISYRDDDQVAFSKSNSSKYINESKEEFTAQKMTENVQIDEDMHNIYYHGSSQKLNKLNSPINWITEDKEYAKYYALALNNTGYVYTCEAELDNVFDAGKTGVNVYALFPITKPYKLSIEFKRLADKLNLSEEDAYKLIDDAIAEYPQKSGEYKTKISTIVRSNAFKKLLQEKGYTSIHTIEYNKPMSRYCDCYGILDSNDVNIISSEEVTFNAKLNDN